MDWSNQALKPTKKFTRAPGFVYQEDEDANSYLMPDLSIYEVDPIEFDKLTGKVCLPKAYKELVGSKATVAGWGYNNAPNGMQNFTEVRPKIAEKNDVLFFEPEMCNALGKINLTFTVCAGGHHTGTEGGDSGGPLVVNSSGRYYLVGTTAFGLPQKGDDGEYQDVAAYMRVAKFCDWIEAATEKEAKCLDVDKAPPLSA
ncbi:Serine proteinase stubble [Aphelenchoides avenae]|nr:Serine proteinase stubble [Aphelenchus avenae]